MLDDHSWGPLSPAVQWTFFDHFPASMRWNEDSSARAAQDASNKLSVVDNLAMICYIKNVVLVWKQDAEDIVQQ